MSPDKTNTMNKHLLAFLFSLLALVTSGNAFAQAASDAASGAMAAPTAAMASAPAAAGSAADAASAPTPAASAPVPNKGDVAWMIVATALVIMMSVPALALFYGGLVRSKNMLSVLMQVTVTFSMIVVLWCLYGYSLAFTEGNAFVGGFDRVFMKGLFDASKGDFAMAATFSKGVVIPELLYLAFQATFAAITCCLIVGAFAERMKFSAVLAFMVLWFTFSYCPIAHMVWFWAGPDAYTSKAVADAVAAKAGLAYQWGRARLRRRHGRAHQLGRRRPGRRVHGRQAPGLWPRGLHAALGDADDGRCRAAVGGLVRLQRRQCAGSGQQRRAGFHEHAERHRLRGTGLVCG